jgi:hypothetical protein
MKSGSIKRSITQSTKFMLMPLTERNWAQKDKELTLRCIVARAENPDVQNIIGIALVGNSADQYTVDVCFFSLPEIDQKFKDEAKQIQEDLGYFRNMQISHSKDFR